MTLLEKLGSDLKIYECELVTLQEILKKEKEMKMMANPFTISISEIMIQTTNAKIESINKQISSQSRFQYVDRRDGYYTC